VIALDKLFDRFAMLAEAWRTGYMRVHNERGGSTLQ
jgi:hypothetical protein